MELLAFGDTGWGDELFYATLMTIAVSITAMLIGFLFALFFTPLKLSKNKDEICITKDWRTGKEDIENSKIVLASGEYNLRFPKMPGRIIMDMCVIFRKEFQLSSYKLDFVSSYFISDSIKNIEHDENKQTTKIYSKNLMGINIGSFIKLEEINKCLNFLNGVKDKSIQN